MNLEAKVDEIKLCTYLNITKKVTLHLKIEIEKISCHMPSVFKISNEKRKVTYQEVEDLYDLNNYMVEFCHKLYLHVIFPKRRCNEVVSKWF